MPIEIDRGEVQSLAQQGAQIVEVLPAHEYEREHLPGAISIPLSTLDRDSAARLDPERPVIVYCHDAL
ncbi:MAG: rhodanese-like domain-containing protein [Thermomicrobiaceae bacterium]|nr:rhodanese-like domain-containing protein [Thermomicrobiaceae bacterium]